MPFTHLHVHTCFSMHDGAADIGALVAKAREFGMNALAITDHDGLYGAIRFYYACKEAGIKPIIGAEVILEGGHHLVLLAMNRKGYSNLCRLITAAHLSHERDEAPELSWRDLARHSDHLIALSGCRRGEIPAAIRAKGHRNLEGANGDTGVGRARGATCGPRDLGRNGPDAPHLASPRNARNPTHIARRYVDLFGRDRFFIELQNHLDSPRSGWLVCELARLAEGLGLQTVATNNVHYVEKEHYPAQDVLVCIKHVTTVNVPLEDRKPNAEFYFKSPEEMERLFRDYPEALRNTERIAEMCDVRLEPDSYHFPHVDLPAGETAASYLRRLCLKGARERYHPVTPAVMERLEHELDIINDLGFAEYFLVVWDIVRFARQRGIQCSGRGSAADSLVCYVLRLTDGDPMVHANLIFERFMSREHSKMPDIDVDFCSRRRDEVVRYIYEKYGRDHVAAVATVNTYQARSAVREVGKALDMDPDEIDRLAKALPHMDASSITEAFETVPEVRDSDLDLSGKEHLVKICELISGFPRQLSVHVGGLLITREPLTDHVPLEWAAKGIVIAQYDKDDVEALGLVKMDILGLRIHSAIADCLEYIEKGQGIRLDLDEIPLDDPKTFDLIRSTRTIGVFQLESPGQRNLLGRTQPENFEDLIVQISLFRPGPVQGDMITPYIKRRHGEEPITYPHAALEPVLKATRGVLVYQEQVLQIAHVLAGFTPGEADQLRRAMTTDRSSEHMRNLRRSFVEGCLRNNVSKKVAEEVWEQVAAFASFGFCKAHACCFAKL
ncbi:MAG: DNA polymerase III subunit alpha, partial [Armatimonadota bacterium]